MIKERWEQNLSIQRAILYISKAAGWFAIILVLLMILLFIINSRKLSKQKIDGAIWSSIKHIGPIPVASHRYTLTSDKLIEQYGFLKLQEKETFCYLMTDISLSQSLMQRPFGRGSITIYTRDDDEKSIIIKGVNKPREVKEKISDLIKSTSSKRREVFVRR